MTQNPIPGGEWMLGAKPVARIGFGAMQLAELPGRPPVDTDTAVAVLHRAFELGIRHFDTADFYGDGVANERLRRAFSPYRDDIVIATKVGANRVDAPVPLVAAQKPSELRASVEANLTRLGTERVDIVNLRRADAAPGIIATGDQVVDLDDQLAELVTLRSEGKIAGIGLSNVSLVQVEHALPVGIVCVQNAYNLLDRRDEALLDLCRREGIAWAPYFPLGSAFAHLPKVAEQPAVVSAAKTLAATPAQVALAWLLQHSPNILLITGTSSIAHLEENVATADVTLDAETIAALDALGAASVESASS
jgi:pyridoxine 4-dehydrogenase